MSQTSGEGVFRRQPLEPGLHFVATPIGSARDITLRALDVLASADVLAAEDTRSARRLMEIHGVPLAGRPLLAYHDHNGAAQRPRLLAALAEGRSVAYLSEAGSPLVADPGYRLARAAIESDLPVRVAPGPSAVLAALAVAGLPSDRFLFAGFPPAAAGARRRWLTDLATVPATLVLFESPRRVHRLLVDSCEALGADRAAAMCRELTKRFEEVRRGRLGELAADLAGPPPKGEIVLVVDRGGAATPAAEDVTDALREALRTAPLRQAASDVSERLGLPRRQVYQEALRLRDEE